MRKKPTHQTTFEKMGTMSQLTITEMGMKLHFLELLECAQRLNSVIPERYDLAWKLVCSSLIKAEETMDLFFKRALDEEVER